MKRYFVLLAAVGLMVAADTKDDAKKELEKLTGTWGVVSFEHAGNKATDDMVKSFDLKLMIKGDAYEVTLGGNSHDKGTLKIDGAKTPKAVDIISTDGPNKGKTLLAIYELNGDEMKCCYDLDGKERPKEFKTAAGTMQLLVVYKKQK